MANKRNLGVQFRVHIDDELLEFPLLFSIFNILRIFAKDLEEIIRRRFEFLLHVIWSV